MLISVGRGHPRRQGRGERRDHHFGVIAHQEGHALFRPLALRVRAMTASIFLGVSVSRPRFFASLCRASRDGVLIVLSTTAFGRSMTTPFVAVALPRAPTSKPTAPRVSFGICTLFFGPNFVRALGFLKMIFFIL